MAARFRFWHRPSVDGGGAGAVPLFGPSGASQSSGAHQGPSELPGVPPGGRPRARPAAGGGGPGGPGGGGSLSKAMLSYVKQHGGGTIAVESQSSAASAIISQGAKVAGIGGFSGRESDVSVAWLAGEVSSGHIRWVLADERRRAAGRPGTGRLPGDTRTGSSVAIAAAAKACRKATLTSSGSSGTGTGEGTTSAASTSTLYDCQGRAAQLLGTQQSKS